VLEVLEAAVVGADCPEKTEVFRAVDEVLLFPGELVG
jgi:hypothetical protein